MQRGPAYCASLLIFDTHTHTHTHTHVPRAWQAKTVKMGDRLEGKALDSFDKKALKKVTVSLCLYYLKKAQSLLASVLRCYCNACMLL
jgi:hypothetical protein